MVLIIVAGVVATISWQWTAITGVLPIARQYWIEVAEPGQPRNAVGAIQILGARSAAARRQDKRRAQRRRAAQTEAAVAQRVVLYEEEPAIRKASARSAPLSRGRKRFRPTPGLPLNLWFAQTWKFPNAE